MKSDQKLKNTHKKYLSSQLTPQCRYLIDLSNQSMLLLLWLQEFVITKNLLFASSAIIRRYLYQTYMINFASIFNQSRSSSNGGLSELLGQPATKMGRLLDEQSFLNEYKTSNPKVIEYMKYEKFEELVEFITVVGSPDDSKRAYKYPFNACELLANDNTTTVEAFFPDEPQTVDEKVMEDVEVEVEEEVQQAQEEIPKEEKVDQGKKEQTNSEPQKDANDEKTSETTNTQQIKYEVINEDKLQPSVATQAQTIQKKYKKVIRKIMAKQQRTIKKELEPLINRLMSYFKNEVNYTLTGYVCKVLTMLFNKKTANFIKYFLQEKFREDILSHAQSRSVGQLIIKVLMNETLNCLEERKIFFHAMLKKLSINSEVYIMSNLSSYITEVIEKAAINLKGANKINQFANIYFSLDVVTQVIKNVISSEENVSIYNAPILLSLLTSAPFVLPEDQSIISDFTSLLEHFIEKSCERLTITSQTHPKIGLGRMKILQILRFILKQNILNSKDIVAKRTNFFNILINLFKEYPLSSMLHNEIVKIIEIALNENENTPLNISVLKNNSLLNFIKEQVEQDIKIRTGTSIYKSRKGFIAHLINISIKLKQVSQTNQTVKKLIENAEYSPIYQSFFDKEVFNSKKSLAGFSMRKDLKHEIKFQKEDIITAYASFLRKCPSPVFDEPQTAETDQHPDLVEELQKQLQGNLIVKQKEAQKHVQLPKSISETQEPEKKIQQQPKFWESVLTYDVQVLKLSL